MTARTVAASAAREAERVLAAHHPTLSIPVPVDTLVQQCGIRRAGKKHEGTHAIGFTVRDALGSVILGVNSAHGRPRQRFALAHGLGHALLHEYDLCVDHAIRAPNGLPAGSTATMTQERAANRFAAELLMPEAAVMRELAAWLGGRTTASDRERLVTDLHKLFQVPYEAMAFRLVDLAVLVP